jgi:hypothetical protein
MDIKLKELDQKNKSDQENLKRIIETVAPITADLLAPVYPTPIETFAINFLQKKPIKTSISIFQPPKQV